MKPGLSSSCVKGSRHRFVKKINMKRGKLLKRLLLRQVREAILTKALMTFFQAMLEKYPLGQQRLPMEVLPSVPSAQQTAPQPTLV